MTQSHDLWPPAAYHRQIELLRNLIGQPIYIVEINETEVNAGVKFPAKPLTLLAIVDYPKPDPYRQLCPHLVVLDDGRGVNLGRVARITSRSAFSASPDDILYVNQAFVQEILYAPRTLSRESVRATLTALLAQIFGDTPGKFLELYADPVQTPLAAPSTMSTAEK